MKFVTRNVITFIFPIGNDNATIVFNFFISFNFFIFFNFFISFNFPKRTPSQQPVLNLDTYIFEFLVFPVRLPHAL